MKQILRKTILAAWRCVIPKNARNSLRLWTMLETPDFAPRLIEKFDDGPVVVLAPHMDDEIIGPGGTVVRHLRAGAGVTFVFMTDGMAGDPAARESLSAERKAESRRAAEMVGVKDLVFLDGPDGALDDTPEMVAALQKILEARRPAIVYAPGLTDHHRDHWATNRILRAALARVGKDISKGLIIRGYEVWTPLPANRMAEISEVAELKREAIGVFVSQTRFVDYAWTILGLNQYRSMVHLCGHGYAEAFLETTPAEFGRLFEQISLKTRLGEEKGA